MPAMHIVKDKIIHASPSKIYGIIHDMSQWSPWSPWLIMDPAAHVDVAADKKSYSWDGPRVGAGKMVIAGEKKNEFVDYDLTFLRPWKSTAKVRMELEAVNGKAPQESATRVRWSMDSRLPFFMFWMKKMMVTFVGMDYERGLKLLADYAQDGEVHSKLTFLGQSDYAGSNYIGIRRKCSMAEMPELMGADFKKLMPWAMQNGLKLQDGMSIYHDFNPVKGVCDYTAAVKYEQLPDSLPDGFITDSQAPTKLYAVEHKGPYEHLGNGWSAMMNMIRNKEIKPVKGYAPFETYGNTPMDTKPNDLLVNINFAVQ